MRRHPPPLLIFGLAILAGLVGGLLLASQLQPEPAAASSTTRLARLAVQEDSFYNYDFNSASASATNVDWPIGLLFWNNASIGAVKSLYRSGFPYSGSTQYGLVNDGAGDVWDSDSGIKDVYCPGYNQSSNHLRLYADGDERLYNVEWGYYVLGTAHKDRNECAFTGTQFGWSEDAEAVFAAYARGRGYAVSEDAIDFQNAEAPRWDGNHYLVNDGRASTVNVGGGSQPIHDVAVTSISGPASVTQGQSATINVGVTNQGGFSESVTISLASNPANGAGDPPAQNVMLNAGQSTTLVFAWATSDATTPGSYSLTATASIASDGNSANNSRSTGISVNPPSTTGQAWVQDIGLSYRRGFFSYTVSGTVTIQGSNGPVGNAAVQLRLTGPSTNVTLTATTNANGVASFSRSVRARGSYTVTVLNVTASGYQYTPSLNVETSQSINVT